MRCSRRNTSNVSTQCYAPARYKSTTHNSTNSNKFCYFSLPDASLSFPWPATCTFAPLCENLSGSDTKFVARIRNTLILGLGVYLTRQESRQIPTQHLVAKVTKVNLIDYFDSVE